MQFKLRNLKQVTYLTDRPLLLSFLIHSGMILIFLGMSWIRFKTPLPQVEIEVIEAPRVTPQAIQITQTKPSIPPPARARAVFGLSRRSISSDSGEAVKMGNTVAKTPDNETLKADDPDSLPVPTEEYLVTEMPTLAEEVRIPYPPDSKKKGIEGAVVMDILIDSNGSVREAKEVQSPATDLRDAALAAVKNFKFKPAKIHNKAVAVRIRYAYRFVFEH